MMKFSNLLHYLWVFIFAFTLQNCQSDMQVADTEVIKKERLFIGTYTRKEGHVNGQAEGVLVYEMNTKTGEINHKYTQKGIVNPSYLALHPNEELLYTVEEVGETDGSVAAFRIEKDSLVLLNKVSAKGAAPCHISLDQKGRFALVANYVGGNVALLPLKANGELMEASALMNHTGKGTHWRQEAPHAHFIAQSPKDEVIYAVDLGLDKIFRYRLDTTNIGLLETSEQLTTNPATGPRHLVFHPRLPFIYVLNELNGTVETFQPDSLGNFSRLASIPTFDTNNKEAVPACAAIHLHPNGQFLYVSNRGTENNIAIFKVVPETGQLQNIAYQSTKGQTPRDFLITKDGRFLLVANQDSNTVVTFKINEDTGMLIETGLVAEVPTPVCLKMF